MVSYFHYGFGLEYLRCERLWAYTIIIIITTAWWLLYPWILFWTFNTKLNQSLLLGYWYLHYINIYSFLEISSSFGVQCKNSSWTYIEKPEATLCSNLPSLMDSSHCFHHQPLPWLAQNLSNWRFSLILRGIFLCFQLLKANVIVLTFLSIKYSSIQKKFENVLRSGVGSHVNSCSKSWITLAFYFFCCNFQWSIHDNNI